MSRYPSSLRFSRGALRPACLFILLASLSVASAKPYPAGIIALFGVDSVQHPIGNLTNKAAWTNPNVDGVRLRSGWNVVQPSETSYNWATLDQAMTLATEHGKRVGVSIAAGISTPQWVYDKGAAKYTLADGSGNVMPLPWDPAFQEQWLAFVRTFGARYDGNPALSYVCATGFMQVCEMFLSKTEQDDANLDALAIQAGYVDKFDAFNTSAEKILAAFMDAFPTTPVILNPVPPFATGNAASQSVVRDWGFANYPGRFGVMYTSLRATPAPHSPPTSVLSFPKGFQMICIATDTKQLYGNPNPPYDPPPPTPLQDALESAITAQGQYVEVYGNDLDVSANQSILPAEAASLKKNLPIQPPTNLHFDQ